MNEQNEKQIRFVLGFILTAAVVLLLGAGRIGDSMLSRNQTLEKARQEWDSAVQKILIHKNTGNTTEYRKIHKMAMEDPVLFLSVACSKLEPESHKRTGHE